MSVKIGILLIVWQNDDLLDLIVNFMMEQCLQELWDIGYIGVECGWCMFVDIEGLCKYLDEVELLFCGGWCLGNLMVNDLKVEIEVICQQVI